MNIPVDRANSQKNLHVVVERIFFARRPRVFQAWTDPVLMVKWFSPATMVPVNVEANVTVGGSYRIGMREQDGSVFYVGGKYIEIRPPERLVFTWAWQTDPPGADSLVTVEFIVGGNYTRVVLRHEQLPDSESQASHRRGWIACLNNLESTISRGEI